MKIYVAGKDMERAQIAMDDLRNNGHVITYDWIVSIVEGPSKEIAILEAEGVRSSDILVYLWESDQESARYEAGMAMGLQKPIIVSGKSDAFFFQLPDIHCVDNDEEILKKIGEIEL